MLLIAAGDHPGRLRSEAAWAHLCGTAPIPASSGKVTCHRLNPGGNREANHALWRIAVLAACQLPGTQSTSPVGMASPGEVVPANTPLM
jgi:transposase